MLQLWAESEFSHFVDWLWRPLQPMDAILEGETHPLISGHSCTRVPIVGGAWAMTTRFLDDKVRTFEILLSWCFPRGNNVWGTFFASAPIPPPLKNTSFIFTVVSPSLTLAHQIRTIATASDLRVDGAKSPDILQKKGCWAQKLQLKIANR